ncbi:hypothetical protein Q1695_000953 [Nippostrongylus brasiliensis]|nr:hypothetical protein Q1695_000953 [Nippostrongylus brasiliensis]
MLLPGVGASVESDLLEVLRSAHVEEFQQKLIFALNIRRLDHINHVRDKELQNIGLSLSQIRSLRDATTDAKQRALWRNSEPELVYIRNENTVDSGAVDPNGAIIPKTQIKLMESIGEGTFSVVKRALWYHPNGTKIDVAVKILRDVSPCIMEDLQVEASHLLKLQHSNLIRLFGIVQQPAMMVFELCEGGELLIRLRDTSKPVPLVTTLLDYCLQVVKGLTFLESKHYVHRDVAARNVLLSKDEKVVKLCDFGLMRGLKENERAYVMHAQKRVPFSWCPPEALRHRRFSHASDVWAFGVTAWEIFTLGEDPWVGCRAVEVLKRLDAGERLEKPQYCTRQIYDLISLCWNIKPDLRPKFSMLRTLLLGAEFNIAEVRDASQSDQRDDILQLSPRDRIIVIDDSGLLWYGQNERTRKFGKFLRSAVFVHGKSVATPKQQDVSVPVGNSRISLPVRGSVPTSSKIRDPLAVDWSDAFDAAAFDEGFSPSRITLPQTGNGSIPATATPFSSHQPLPSPVQLPTDRSFVPTPPSIVNYNHGLGLASSTSSYPPQSLPSSSNLSASRPVISSSTVPSKPQQENGSTSIMASIMGQLRVDTTKNTLVPQTQQQQQQGCLVPTPIPPAERRMEPNAGASSSSIVRPRPQGKVEPRLVTNPTTIEQLTLPSSSRTTQSHHAPSAQDFSALFTEAAAKQAEKAAIQPKENGTTVVKPMPNVSAPGRSQELNVPNESDVGLVHRRVSSQPILDENRRSRVQSEIFNALPPPSSLFFGSTTNIAANHVTTATSTPKPKVESHNNTVSDAPLSSSSSSSSSKPALSIEGVLQPIRLPIGGVNPVTRPPAAPVAEFRPTSVVNPQNPTLVIPQQATIQHTPVSMQRQLPLYSVSNNAIRFGMPPTYGTGPLTLPNRGYAATPYGNGLPVWGSSTLPPRLDPVTPFRIGENEDIIEALDPLLSSSRTQRSTNGQQATNGISGISRAQEMEILYSDAPFADHSRCDRMVASCQGNIEAALKELKIEHLIETQIASSREAAMRALTSKAWDLNAAAELLLTST